MWETHVVPTLAVIGLGTVIYGAMHLALWVMEIVTTTPTKRDRT